LTKRKNPIFCHIKSNNSETAKVKIVKNEKDPPLFTGKLLIKFQTILVYILERLPKSEKNQQVMNIHVISNKRR
jgi:hypothetical protein